jgi:type IV pilus assembly protein PilM
MLFGKKDRLIGLDIGSRTIKAAEISGSKKGKCLKRFGIVDIRPGLIEDGTIKDTEQVAALIRQLFKKSGIKAQNVALSVGGYSVIVKKINVQAMPEEQLQNTIQFEAEQYIPFDISDVNLDFQILGNNPNNPNQMNVLLVAAKKELINSYVDLAQMAGLNPCIIDVDSFALQNIYDLNESPDENVNTALIDIGASKTSLNLLKGKTSVFMRDVSMGCGQINQRIASQIGCTDEEAEQIKSGAFPEKMSVDALTDIVSTVVSDWCTEIRRALDFFYSSYPDDQIQKIVLSGGGGKIEAFRQLLSVETSAEVATINPFSGFNVDENRFDPEFLTRIAPQASISMGLATRKVDDK